MNSVRSLKTSISIGNVEDQLAAFLYATGVVNDDEDVKITLPWKIDMLPLDLTITRHKGVEVIQTNG